MTIHKAPIPGKTQIGAHAPLFLRITTPAERRHIQTHPGETFLLPNEDSETGGWPRIREQPQQVRHILGRGLPLGRAGRLSRVALLGPERGEAPCGHQAPPEGPGLTPATLLLKGPSHGIHRSC